MTDAAYVAAARKTLRRRLFQRLKALGLGQDATVQAMAKVEQSVLEATNLPALAAVAASAGEVAAALAVANPADPALVSFNAARDSAPASVRDVFTFEP